jgi:hypothetical protein
MTNKEAFEQHFSVRPDGITEEEHAKVQAIARALISFCEAMDDLRDKHQIWLTWGTGIDPITNKHVVAMFGAEKRMPIAVQFVDRGPDKRGMN